MESFAADELPGAVARLDRGRRIVDANAVLESWTGLTLDELTGRTLASLLVPGSADGVDDGVARLLHSDGSQRAVIESHRRGEDGEIVLLLDASRRVAFEERLTQTRSLEERTRNRLELIIEASIAFAAATSEGQLAEILATTVARSYRAEQSAVFLLSEQGTFEQVAGSNPFEQAIGSRALPAQAAMLRRVVTVSGVDQAETVAPILGAAMRQSGVLSLLAAPIQHDDELFGVFACFFFHPRQFDSEAAPLADALAGQAAQTVTALRLQRRLEHAAMHDETTGLPNRRLLEAQMLEYARTASTGLLAALFIDLDGFKGVNDNLGHHTGDELLREVAARLQSAVRQQDLVARYGGDEFVVVCEVPDPAAAHDVAERIREAVGRPYDGLPDDFPISASIGVSAVHPLEHAWNPDRLIRSADQAMYIAKNLGGDRYVDAAEIPEQDRRRASGS
ncbi:diguanylate cyclase [Leifsonia sp. AG29]|uniref:diguanylate cyclase n=1 Tax=Leifsonia sp. AG29 TaxID=2598860 RepID=UPI00131C0CFB|nr:diguanylate cyclase [Leifsonia sp. AG29]